MRLLRLELRKLLCGPAIWLFLALCLAVNTLFVFGTGHRYAIAQANEQMQKEGTRYSEDYGLFDGLAEDMLAILRRDQDMSPLAKKVQLWKYAKLAPEIEATAQRGDYLDVYFFDGSKWIHENAFEDLGRLLNAECAAFFVLMALWALGCEHMAGTAQTALATKTGRKIAAHKIAAALLLGTGFFAALHGLSYALCFAVNDFSQVWGQSISSQSRTILMDFFGPMPILTWGPMTVGGYFWRCLLASFLNCLALGLTAIPFGLLVKNVYAAFCGVAGVCFLQLMAGLFGSAWGVQPFAWYLAMALPVTQLLRTRYWCTDGGGVMLLPHFELLYPLIVIALLCPVLLFAVRRFKRKEI